MSVEPGVIGLGALRSVRRDGEIVWKLQCPSCGTWADLDDDQLHGRVSTHHATEDGGCGYHETVDWMGVLRLVHAVPDAPRRGGV